MGGLGSGRPNRSGRVTAQACQSLDIHRLKTAGALVPGWTGRWDWSRDGEQVASIGLLGGRDRIVLVYRYRQPGADWQDVVEPIRIRRVPCRFGGDRPLFECPGIVNGLACGRAAVKLYCAGRDYLCRQCYGITYASQGEDRSGRALRRAHRLRAKLGGAPGMASPLAARPKGMWQRTYDRLCAEIDEAEDVATERLWIKLGQMLAGESGGRTSKGGFWT